MVAWIDGSVGGRSFPLICSFCGIIYSFTFDFSCFGLMKPLGAYLTWNSDCLEGLCRRK